MEIQENNVLKSLKENLEISVDKILSKHSQISDEIPDDQFEDIVDKIIKSKEICTITEKFYEYSEMEQTNFMKHFNKSDLYNDDKLDNIFGYMGQNKSSESRINGLNFILNYSVLDLVDQRRWTKLSKVLRECLISKNRDVFSNALKIHIKISNHPHTIIEGTLNLIKTIIQYVQSKKLQAYSVSIDLRIRIQEQMIKILYLLLNNITQIFKSLNIGKDKQIEELIANFFDLQIIDTYWERNDHLYIIYYISVLDPTAKWFKQLFFTLQQRKIVLVYLLKNPAFTRLIFKEFMSCLAFDNSEVNIKKCFTKEINYEMIKISSFSSCANIISTLMSYTWTQKLFPIDWKINEPKMTQTGITSTMISAMQCLNRRKHKRNILCDAIKIILTKNPYLLYKKDILHLLIKPFLLKIDDRHRLSEICRTNLYVLHIINEITNTQDGVFIIFGFMPDHNRKKYDIQYIRSVTLDEPLVISTFIEKYKRHYRSSSDREILSLAKIICEFTTNFVRHQINLHETARNIDDMVYELYECCSNIHSLHSHVIFLVNSLRLIDATLQYYKILIDRNLLLNTMNSFLRFLITICFTMSGTDYFLKQDSELLYIFCKHYFFLLDDCIRYDGSFSLFLVNVSNTVPGCIAIAECRRRIVTPFLNRIWKLDEDQMLYLSGSDRLVEEEIFKFMRFIYVLQFNFKCVRALLINEEDDESTLVDTEQKPSSLKDLLDETLNSTGPGSLPCYVGLCTFNILIKNLDTFLYLEQNTNLQVELEKLQSQCTIASNETEKTSNETTLIIDECSLMRQHLVTYIENIGVINNQCNKTKPQRRLNDLQKFLNESRNGLHDQNWLIKIRNVMRQTCEPSIRTCNETVFVDLIQQIRLTIPNIKSSYIWPEHDKHLPDLFPEDYHGVSLIVRFGKMSKILSNATNHEDSLSFLLKQVYSFLNVKRETFERFDWFVGIIFLMCGGNIERTKIVLQCFINLPVALYIWPTFASHAGRNKHINFYLHFDHTLNLLVGDLEIFKPALENASISWNFIVRNWINQCFFNVLEWNEICNFIVVCVLYPIDYVLFFLICCAQHLESRILMAITSNDITNYANLLYLGGLHISNCFDTMEQLGKQYKNILSSRH